MLELKCPQIESSEYLCDRAAEYQVDGTIYCARHARRLIELKTQKKEVDWMAKYDAISEKLNDVAMNGFAEEQYGSCQEEGFWAGLIITDKTICLGEWPDLTDDVRPLIGIIEENDQGFVDYELFPTEKDARAKWKNLTNMWERLYHPETAYA